MRGKKTSDKKVKEVAKAVAIDEEASLRQLQAKTKVPFTTIQGLVNDDERFVQFVQKEKKRLKVEYVDLIIEHVNAMRAKMDRASYRDIVGGFKIVHEKAFPEDGYPSIAQQFNVSEGKFVILDGSEKNYKELREQNESN